MCPLRFYARPSRACRAHRGKPRCEFLFASSTRGGSPIAAGNKRSHRGRLIDHSSYWCFSLVAPAKKSDVNGADHQSLQYQRAICRKVERTGHAYARAHSPPAGVRSALALSSSMFSVSRNLAEFLQLFVAVVTGASRCCLPASGRIRLLLFSLPADLRLAQIMISVAPTMSGQDAQNGDPAMGPSVGRVWSEIHS